MLRTLNEAFHSQAVAFNGVLSDKDEGARFDESTGLVHFRFYFPNATSVVVATDAPKDEFPLTKVETEGTGGATSMWVGSGSFSTGFHYVFVRVDGTDVISPYLPIGFGYSKPTNYVDVPAVNTAETKFYMMRTDVQHGSVVHDVVPSKATGRTEACLIYLPPSYFADGSSERTYPTLYLQAGHGSNETDWAYQGKINLIADNLIAENLAQEMVIVMVNGMVQVSDKKTPSVSRTAPAALTSLIVYDVLPHVERKYRVRRSREDRAIAGLSMGSMQAGYIGVIHSDLFAYIGLFSGFFRVLINLHDGVASPISKEEYEPEDDFTSPVSAIIASLSAGSDADTDFPILQLRGHSVYYPPEAGMDALGVTRETPNDSDVASKRHIHNLHIRKLLLDPERCFNRDVKLFFRCIGDEDEFIKYFYYDDALVKALGIPETRVMYKGHHSWQVWREAARDFLQLLFTQPKN